MRKNYDQPQRLKTKWLLLWLLLILPFWGFSQTSGITVTWNFQVGCNDVESSDPKERDNIETWESIGMGSCIRVCEKSEVMYTVNSTSSNIASVTWNAAGGVINSTSSNPYQANITWGVAGSGTVLITIHYTNNTQETKSICIEKIDGPQAKFVIAGSGGHEVCQNTPVYFDNLSTAGNGTGIVSYQWDFGDGTPTTSIFEPSHAFATPGTKTVRLTVTNQCNCSTTYDMDIEVIQATPVEISCASVVCAGSEQSYTANNSCDGQWDVIGGSIVNINGNQITIKWDQVNPADGFGYVMYKSACGCPVWTTLKIPVVVDQAIINGPTTVCTDKQYKYEMPRWPTTNVQWDVNGPAPVQTTYSSQRNEVYLKFNAPGTYTLSNIYNNTLLQCEGKSETLTIVVTEPLTVTGGQSEVCTGNSLTFNSNGSGNVEWEVTFNGDVIYTQALTGSFQYQFQNPGTYIITAHTPGGCIGEGTVVKALSLPSAPTGNITGDQLVCAGVPYTYTLSPTNAGFIPVWSVTNGVIQGSNTGSSVTVIFNASSTNYTVSVQNRTNGGLGCLSAPISYAVQKVDLSTISVQGPAGVSVFCPSSSATFTANFNGIVPDDLYWTLGNSNFASLLPDPTNPNAIIVSFNEISGSNQTYLRLNVVKCGQLFTKDIPLELQTLPVISMNGGDVCEGSATINVVVNIPANVNSGNLLFTFPNGDTEPFTLTSGGTQTITINNHFVNNTGSVVSQSLALQLDSPNGCNYIATTAVNFNIKPELDITITPGYFYIICPSSTYSVPLYAQVPSGTNVSSYQWYHNNVAIPGAIASNYLIENSTQPSPGGNYYVIVTADGCPSRSQNINVIASCGSFPPCTISPNPNIVVSANWIDCNTITATATFAGSPTAFEWIGSPNLQLQPGSTSTSAVFSVVEAGVHNVGLTLNYGGCTAQNNIDVTKNYKPNFNAKITCNSNGTYNVTLTDSSLLSGITSSAIAYSYTMNGGSQQNGQTVTYSGLQPGTAYNFAITLDGPGAMPNCSYTESILMPTLPNLQFNVSQATICKGEVITLTIPAANFLPNHIYKWKFAQTAYIASSPITTITLNEAGFYNIELEVTTPNNCTYNSFFAAIVEVKVADFQNISLQAFNNDVCETSANQPLLLVNATASQYQWMNGGQIAGTTSVNYFTPTVSGSYWVVLTDPNNGCLDKSTASTPVNINIRKAPQVSIIGSSQACENNTVTLQGVVTDNNLQYEWTQSFNGGANTVVQTGNSATPIAYTSSALAVGTYIYTLKVWSANDPSCFGVSSFTVTVSSPPPPPQVSVNISYCQPYQVQLTVQNPGAGVYNWSNGAYGSDITVTKGGLYQVIYTAPSGCKSSVQVSVPHSVEDLMWIFPTGCYDMCPGDAYIIGPLGTFTNHEWQYFGNMQQGGNPGFIDPYWPQSTGTHNLWLQQGQCDLQSGNMHISPSADNPWCAPRECKLEVVIKAVKREGNSYLIFGDIFNFGSQAVTVTLSSVNGYGNYIPSSIPIQGGGSYNMNPVIFYPNSSFPGGVDEMLVTANVNGCKIIVKIVFDDGVYSKSTPAYVQTQRELTMVPNPAKDEVKISFDTGNAKVEATNLYIYDQGGRLRYQEKLKGAKGETRLNVSQWLQGMYLVSISTTAEPLQGKLLKK